MSRVTYSCSDAPSWPAEPDEDVLDQYDGDDRHHDHLERTEAIVLGPTYGSIRRRCNSPSHPLVEISLALPNISFWKG